MLREGIVAGMCLNSGGSGAVTPYIRALFPGWLSLSFSQGFRKLACSLLSNMPVEGNGAVELQDPVQCAMRMGWLCQHRPDGAPSSGESSGELIKE